MDFFGWSFFLLAVLQLTAAAPAVEDAQLLPESEDGQLEVVREKRKIEEATAAVAPEFPREEIADNHGPKSLADSRDIPELPDQPTIDRIKKDACAKHPKLCDVTTSELFRTNPELFYAYGKDADPAVVPFLAPAPVLPKNARTIEPIYSFGPVNVNSPGYQTGYSLRPSSSYASGSSAISSDSSYGAPGGLQFHAVIPIHHRAPAHHHASWNSNQQYYDANPNIVYYAAPEPVFVQTDQASVIQSAPVPTAPAPSALYCKTLKSHDLAKALDTEAKKASNNTLDEKEIASHIQRVNEIKEEITQLNAAAQKLIDQQERVARMQQEHIMASRQMPFPYFSRAADPLQRHEESMMRMPYGMYGSYMRPYYRQDGYYGAAAKEDQEAKDAGTQSSTTPKPEMSVRSSEEMMRQYFHGMSMMPIMPSYGGFRAEESSSPFLRSETGFNTQPLLFSSKSNVASYPNNPDDVKFFMRMLEAGKDMGVLSKDIEKSFDKSKNEAQKTVEEEKKKIEEVKKLESETTTVQPDTTEEQKQFFMRMLEQGKQLGFLPKELDEAMNKKKVDEDEPKVKSETLFEDLETGGKSKKDKRGLFKKTE